jgi:hypothetical protein
LPSRTVADWRFIRAQVERENFHQFNSNFHKEKEMADFRKWLFAFAVVALVLGLQVSAQAQGITPAFSCVANAGVPPIVRSEGVTELVGDLILNCSGGTPTGLGVAIPLSNVQIFLNTNITSRLLNSSNLSEATLTIDEPYAAGAAVPSTAPGVAGAPQTQLACAAVNSTNCAILGVGATPAASGPVGANGPYNGSTGHYNIFQGFQNGVNSVAWLGVPIDSPGTNSAGQLNTRVIRITNVRANACLLGVSSTLIPTQIVMFISVNGSQQVTINNPQQTVAFIQPGLITSVNSSRNYNQCTGLNQNPYLTTGSAQSGTVNQPVLYNYVQATEGFASSFKVRNFAEVSGPLPTTPPTSVPTTNSLQNVLGFSYNTESGFVANPTLGPGATGWGTAAGSVGQADTGTQLAFNIAGVGSGVSVFVPPTIPLFATGASVNSDNATIAGTITGWAVLVSGTSGTAAGATTVFGGSQTFANISFTGGTGTVVYEVVYENPNVLETTFLPVVTAFLTNTTNNLPGLGQSTSTVNFAPLSSSPTATTGAIPRFCQPYAAKNQFAVNICACNLLFPFVTNQAGFDTGIAIANTSLDPFGTAQQTGIVTLNYYGGTTGGGAAPAAQKSQPVPAGAELVFTLSNGGNLGVAATPGFQGYIIAQANFQWCHGFAFISDLGAQKLAEGYLALQIDTGGLNRTSALSEMKSH